MAKIALYKISIENILIKATLKGILLDKKYIAKKYIKLYIIVLIPENIKATTIFLLFMKFFITPTPYPIKKYIRAYTPIASPKSKSWKSPMANPKKAP